VACAAALASLDLIEREGLIERGRRLGELLLPALRELHDRFEVIGDVRGIGAMAAIELVDDRETKAPAKATTTRVLDECLRQGLIALKAGTYDNVVRLLPPLTISESLVDEGLGILEKSLAAATA
jgi:4-aminobutyrate aminotransferase / (S)-3-amino-2-methylpropionate transaminase / 5-aminovalerate transaminase